MARAMRNRRLSSNCEAGSTPILFSIVTMPSTLRTRFSMSSRLYGMVTQPVSCTLPSFTSAEMLSKTVSCV